MKARRFTFILFLCLAAFGCADDVSKAPDKGEISQIQESDKDYCSIHNWYDDGVCDEFCMNPDPDCADQCSAVPTCGPDEVEVEQCSNEDLCTEVSVCGQTIFCEGDLCEQPPPACGPNENQVDWCGPNEPGCSVYPHECAPDLYCLEDVATCDAVPACPTGSTEVDSCGADPDCFVEYACGQTINCSLEPDDCRAVPTCEANEYHVSSERCAQTTECRTDVVCGHATHCMPVPEACNFDPAPPSDISHEDPPACTSDQTPTTESDCSLAELNSGICEATFGWGFQCTEFIYCRN